MVAYKMNRIKAAQINVVTTNKAIEKSRQPSSAKNNPVIMKNTPKKYLNFVTS